MKHLLSTILSVLLIAGLCTVPVVISGCTSSQQQVAYKSLKSVQEASIAGLIIYGNAFKAGKITPEKREQVLEAYTKYQAGFALALDAAQFNWNAPAGPELTSLVNLLLDTINTFSK
jgi:phosphoribosylformimino-5-aminoimidazole carboxamide ribonucleotide (ProFAR) isomerase